MPKQTFEAMFDEPLRFGELGYALSRVRFPEIEQAAEAFVAWLGWEEGLAEVEGYSFQQGFVRFGFMPAEYHDSEHDASEPLWWGPVQNKRGARPVWFIYHRVRHGAALGESATVPLPEGLIERLVDKWRNPADYLNRTPNSNPRIQATEAA